MSSRTGWPRTIITVTIRDVGGVMCLSGDCHHFVVASYANATAAADVEQSADDNHLTIGRRIVDTLQLAGALRSWHVGHA